MKTDCPCLRCRRRRADKDTTACALCEPRFAYAKAQAQNKPQRIDPPAEADIARLEAMERPGYQTLLGACRVPGCERRANYSVLGGLCAMHNGRYETRIKRGIDCSDLDVLNVKLSTSNKFRRG